MGEENRPLTQPSLGCQGEDVDARPDTSPYTGPHATLHFKDGPPLSIPTAVLSEHPRLSSRCEWDLSLHLKDIPASPGHVLVHYILTGTYQCLKPKGSSASEKCAAEFATSVRVYEVARDLDLPALGELEKGEIQRLGRTLHVTQLLDTMMDAHPTFRPDDTWFHDYLKSVIKSFIENPPSAPVDASPGHLGQPLSLTSLVLKSVIELSDEKGYAIRQNPIHFTMNPSQKSQVMAQSELKPVPSPNLTREPRLDGEEARLSTSEQRKKGKKKADMESIEDAGLPATVEPDPASVRRSEPTEQTGEQQEKSDDDEPPSAPPSNVSRGSFGEQPDQTPRKLFTSDSPKTSPFGGIFTSASSSSATNSGSLFENQADPKLPYLFESSGISKEPNIDNSYLDKVPLTTEASMWHDVPESLYSPTISRFLHICVQDKFAGFSPEELRLKHQRWEVGRQWKF
ncbi:hypothetical protein F5Y05DRAFT_425055 [Hypoxylon sp. FL0543]|nr:hypothetical protein F5Y05DRAFT_425055 [Hypoxylon sp. FL0543]